MMTASRPNGPTVVTGGAGFIGTHVVDALLDAGHDIVVVDDLRHRSNRAYDARASFVELDLSTPGAAETLRSIGAGVIVHLAAQGGVNRSWRDPLNDATANVLGTLSVLDAAAGGGSRVVFSSSGGALYGDAPLLPAPEDTVAAPRSPYGTAKLAAEQYLGMYARTRGLSAVALRFANIYGPGQDGTGEAGVVAITCNRILDGQRPVVRGDGSQTRDFTFVEDVAHAVTLAAGSTVTGAFNIGTGVGTPIRAVVEGLAAAAGWTGGIEEAPLPDGEVRHSRLDVRRAADELGWSATTSLEHGLRRTWNDVGALTAGAPIAAPPHGGS